MGTAKSSHFARRRSFKSITHMGRSPQFRSSLIRNVMEVELAMCPKEIGNGERMEIAQARQIHQGLIAKLMSGPGDSEGAMYRAQQKYGLSYWGQWNLRFKGRASLEFLGRLHGAYLQAVENSVKCDLAYLKVEQAKGADDVSVESLVAEAEALLARIEAKKAGMK